MKATKQSHDWHCHNHDTYGWRGEECKQCPAAPYDATSKLQAENAALKADNELLRWLSFRDERDSLKEQVAQLTSTIKHAEQMEDMDKKELTLLQSKSAALVDALEKVALIAHAGGLATMTQDGAMNTIRKLTLPYFDLSKTTDETITALATVKGE